MQEILNTHYYHLHQIPELSDHLDKTTEYILQHLPPCTIHNIPQGGLLAYFDKHQKETIAFRADCDALPLQEENQFPYMSKHPNCMHACGHDGHMSILLTLAQQLPHLSSDYNVLCIFEYAEETYGGAKYIVQNPLFLQYSPIAIYGLHIWPYLPMHSISLANMSSSCEVTITIHGKASHIAQATEGIDANEIAGQFLSQAILQYPDICIRFGIIKGGTAPNILSNLTILTGTIRCRKTQTQEFAKRYLWQLATLYMMRYQNLIEVQFNEGYPAIINHPQLLNQTQQQYLKLQQEPTFTFASDSFAYYPNSLYVFLGSGTNQPLHTTTYQFPLEILSTGYLYFQSLLTKVAVHP